HRQGRPGFRGARLPEGQPSGMTPLEWTMAGIALALAVLAISFRGLAMRRLGIAASSAHLVRTTQDGGVPQAPGREEPAAKAETGQSPSLADLEDLEVSDVMVHRTHMRSINADEPPEAIMRAVIQSPHTRMPLWRGSLDNIVGVLHAKDV